MEKILITAPVRNRAWILSEYLNCLECLEYPKQFLSFHFLLNDSIDNSEEILREWKEKNEKHYRYIEINKINLRVVNDIGEEGKGRKNGVIRNRYIYRSLSMLRNILLNFACFDEELDRVFSIDSDILIKSCILRKLLQTNKNIVAGLIENGTRCWNFIPFSGNRHLLPSRLFEVKTTGAVYLIGKEVFQNQKIRYSPCSSGEDEGFCHKARAEGYKSYVLTEKQLHIYNREAN